MTKAKKITEEDFRGQQTNRELAIIRDSQIVDISQVKGVGEKTVKKIYTKLGTTNLRDIKTIPVSDLRGVISDEVLSNIYGFTPKKKKKFTWITKKFQKKKTPGKVMNLSLQKSIISARLSKFLDDINTIDWDVINDQFDELDPTVNLNENWETMAREVLGYVPHGVKPISARARRKKAQLEQIDKAYEIINDTQELHSDLLKIVKDGEKYVNYDYITKYHELTEKLLKNNLILRSETMARSGPYYDELELENMKLAKELKSLQNTNKQYQKDISKLLKELDKKK